VVSGVKLPYEDELSGGYSFEVRGIYRNQGRVLEDVQVNAIEQTQFDDDIELRAGVLDPDYGRPISFQAPRAWRLAARWEF
jgi:hypothetical protein